MADTDIMLPLKGHPAALTQELAATPLPDLVAFDPGQYALFMQDLREKARNGTMTEEDQAKAIQYLRAARVHAAGAGPSASAKRAAASRKPGSKQAKLPVDSDALLDELGGL